MARRALSALLLAALACDVAYAKFGRYSFPEGFIFGTGSASYQVIDDRRCSSLLHIPDSVTLPPLCLCVQASEQVGALHVCLQYEGAYKEGGKGLSVWDIFSHIPGLYEFIYMSCPRKNNYLHAFSVLSSSLCLNMRKVVVDWY